MNTQKQTKQKVNKPIFQSSLYQVMKRGGSFVVTLASDSSKVQYSGQKDWCVDWATENSVDMEVA